MPEFSDRQEKRKQQIYAGESSVEDFPASFWRRKIKMAFDGGVHRHIDALEQLIRNLGSNLWLAGIADSEEQYYSEMPTGCAVRAIQRRYYLMSGSLTRR